MVAGCWVMEKVKKKKKEVVGELVGSGEVRGGWWWEVRGNRKRGCLSFLACC